MFKEVLNVSLKKRLCYRCNNVVDLPCVICIGNCRPWCKNKQTRITSSQLRINSNLIWIFFGLFFCVGHSLTTLSPLNQNYFLQYVGTLVGSVRIYANNKLYVMLQKNFLMVLFFSIIHHLSQVFRWLNNTKENFTFRPDRLFAKESMNAHHGFFFRNDFRHT